ncbi:hypothetical protein Q5425_26200 [Amycolatopsis sp. A133]|uniref:hypothetical protein n=1 Tax=Amycolatopsis sp. A133 TaxID=3064472 RepID=UPI0027FD4866|nr:hypothetical protein [Amycolatopsis sp. A133]MDQ7807245.1 hypothetical protein [Amycolatopsis sp. A133]
MTDVEDRLRRAFHALADTVDVAPAPFPAPRRRLVAPLAAAAATVLVAGVIVLVATRPGPAPAPPATPPPPPPPTLVTLPNFALLTHCGVDEAKIGAGFYEAETPLIGPARSAPPGWDNPYQEGTMTLGPPGSAVFRDRLGHEVRFRLRPGATEFKQLCD